MVQQFRPGENADNGIDRPCDGGDLVIHQSAFTPFVLRVRLLEVVGARFHRAAAAGGEHVEHLAAEVVGLDEGVDDSGSSVPPHGEADPHRVVVGDVLAFALDGRTRALVLHLQRGTGLLVAPVEVGGGVRLFRGDFVKVGVELLGEFLCGGLGGAGG